MPSYNKMPFECLSICYLTTRRVGRRHRVLFIIVYTSRSSVVECHPDIQVYISSVVVVRCLQTHTPSARHDDKEEYIIIII